MSMPLARREGVGHGAADAEHPGACDDAVQEAKLVADFCAATDDGDGFALAEDVGEAQDLRFEQQAGGAGEFMRHGLDGGCARDVRRRKRR